MKIFIFGSNGQLGRSFREIEELYYDNDVFFFNKNELDITNSNQLNNLIDHNKPDLIINAAAYTAVDKAENESKKSRLINSIALEKVSKVCFEKEIILIHFSTDYVFDGTKESAYIETDKTNPQSVYGKTKLEGEKNIINSGCQYFILRTSWVYSEYGNNFLKTILRLEENLDEIKVVNDQLGCPTYARDIAKCVINILPQVHTKKLNGIYHLAGPEACSWFDFAKRILLQKFPDFDTNRLIKIKTEDYPTDAVRPKNSELDSSKFYKTFKSEQDEFNISINEALKNLNT